MVAKLSSRTRGVLVDLGERIRIARRKRGVSRRALAEKIGMLPTNYARIERGKMNLTVETLLRVADGLGMVLSVRIAAPRKTSSK